ncbi:MAG: hypothetical protein CML50_20485, partial [Rhodobacteraceae bacterium]|nr:hypothetical protein [Paracoccaceae bacterium]
MLIELISIADRANVTPTKRCNSPRSQPDDPPRDRQHESPRRLHRRQDRDRRDAGAARSPQRRPFRDQPRRDQLGPCR